jgi:hypothetical protein
MSHSQHAIAWGLVITSNEAVQTLPNSPLPLAPGRFTPATTQCHLTQATKKSFERGHKGGRIPAVSARVPSGAIDKAANQAAAPHLP